MTKLNELACQILEAKYYQPGETCPEDVFERVATVVSIPDVIDNYIRRDAGGNNYVGENLMAAFGQYEYLARRVAERRCLPILNIKDDNEKVQMQLNWVKEKDKYYIAMCNLDFLPATPTLMNAGAGGMLSSCFAIRVEDTMEDIFQAVKEVAIISQRGGGVGLDVSNMRSEGSPVGNKRGVSSGPISFLKVFNETGNQVRQGGSRRAALLAGMRIDHPDILKFIHCKEKEGELSNFNMSVFVTDAFMTALKEDKEIELTHPRSKENKKIKAKDLWNEIVKNAWRLGDPGVIFQDRINKDDPARGAYGNMLTNPCSEIPLNPYSSCNLASINLMNFIGDDTVACPVGVPGIHFSFEKLTKTVELVTRFLDNVIDINNYPLDKITDITLKIRPIGLGIMGLHDVMLALGIEYGSEVSLKFIDKLYNVIKPTALETSTYLASRRGVPEDLKEQGITRRNGTLLTVPPTGTISIIANQVSSGIEPVFQWEYTRKDSYGEHKMRHWLLEECGSIDKLPSHAKTALEITPEAHVKVQARVQHFLDSSVSKTVNLPNNYTVEDVDKIYRMAYDLGCKSITVYRTGSRKEEVLVKTEEKKENKKVEHVDAISKAEKIAGVSEPKVPPRPAVLFGCTYCIRTSLGKVYITINEDKHGVREVFITLSKAGSTMNAHCSVEGRMISNQLKYGVPLQSIINHLKDTKDIPTWWNGMQINSVPDAVAKALEDYLKNFEGFSEFMEVHQNEEGMQAIQNAEEDEIFDPCPDCGNPLRHEGGCKSCSCGYSACG